MPSLPSHSEQQHRAIKRRAVDAALWGMPAVNYDLMLQAARKIGAGQNEVVYWSRLSDWKNQTLTPNPDAIYIMPFFDTSEAGPMVLEIPPAEGGVINGSIMDCWQTPLEDVGPAGVDKGKGGKYVILPPGHEGPVPAGHIPLQSANNQGYALLRSILPGGSEEEFAKALAYGRRVRLYPLSSAGNPETTWVDASGKLFDATIPYDVDFFKALDRIVQHEPWLERDRVMIDHLRTLGIAKCQKFKPGRGTAALLKKAMTRAHEEMNALYEAGFQAPFYEGTGWALPAPQEVIEAMGSGFGNPDAYPIDQRGMIYSFAFFCAKHLGAGQFYLLSIADAKGRALDGGKTWHLKVPAKVPVKQYWSATVYDRATHALLRNVKRASRSSQSPDLRVNEDGSVDVWFGPRAPSGATSNWVPTKAGEQFEVLFRFYGPDETFFRKVWQLPDIERA